jgi:4-hydroxybenzoate polyprenyltransferase
MPKTSKLENENLEKMPQFSLLISALPFWKYLKIARPDHYVKNVFILPGVAIAVFLVRNLENGRYRSASNLIFNFIIGLIATCCAASANYVINEWLDAEFDRHHPVKKERVAVTEGVNPKLVVLEYVLFAAVSIGLSMSISFYFLLCELWLLLMGVVYNVRPLRLKDIPYLDVLSESVNNAIRLLIGWFLVSDQWLPPASIIIGYWMAGAFLMAIKRYAEYRMIGDPVTARLYRKSFASYNEVSLLVSSVFYALLSVFFIGVFLMKYRIELILTLPFLCGLYCLYLKISYKDDSAVQKPEKLYKERGLMIYLLFLIMIFIALLAIDIPVLETLLDNAPIPAPPL